jgi:shikimate dehydrogenase
MGAREILRISRSGREGAITYEEMYERHTDAEIVINTTPVGMFPSIEGLAADIKRFTRLEGVVDAVYNPLRTPLVREAMRMGVAAEGGLYMLVAQAVRASEIFLGITYPEGTLDRVFGEILAEKENVVLIGMPASGKSTVGAMLGERLGRELVDTDAIIAEKAGMEIRDIFATMGEARFREMEHEAVLHASAMTSVVIATGGGAILRDDNVDALRANGRLYFLDRSPELLIPTDSRPLSSDKDAMIKRYNERYSRYCEVADEHIDGDGTPSEVADKIRKWRKRL